MKQLIAQYQQKIFYLLLILLLVGSSMLSSFAQNAADPYQNDIDRAVEALEKADTRAAYQAFARARKQARKNKDQAAQDAFRDCLRKIPFYEAYFPLMQEAEHQLQEENYQNAQLALLAARDQLDRSMAVDAGLPTFAEYETGKRRALDEQIGRLEANRLPLLEQALAQGEDLLLQGRPGEALDLFYQARDLALDQQGENRRYRIGERILKAKLHYDVYTQINLGRREAGYRRYPEAQRIFQDALAKMEQSREYYFPRLENIDNQKQWQVQEMIDEVNAKRVKSYEQALRRGQDYLEQDQLEDALQAFSYARQQMLEEDNEPQRTGIHTLIGQTEHRILVGQGDIHLQQGRYLNAIAAYQEAQRHLPTADLARKIDDAIALGYRQAFDHGLQAFAQGQYEQAREYYDLAAGFQDTPELRSRLDQHYQSLVALGRQEADRAQYDQAQTHYQSARLFSDTPEVQELIGSVQGGMDYEIAYTTGLQQLREGRIDEARQRFEQARSYRNSVEVQDQLFAIDDYQLALQDGRQAFERNAPGQARIHFQKARDIFDTPEVNDWLRRTGAQPDYDRTVVSSYDAQPVFAGNRSLLPKGVGNGRIDFNFNTVLWMRPDCRLDWSVELYNDYGTLVRTEQIDSDCRFTFTNLPDGTYTFWVQLKEDDQIATYRTENDRVTVRNGETVTVAIDAVAKQ